MRSLCFVITATLLFAPLSIHRCSAEEASRERGPTASNQEWTPLFDGKSLDGWYIFLSKHQKNEDPAQVFQVHDGVIHVYKDQADGEPTTYGYIATEPEYANYHLRLEFKWGKKKFPPRHEVRRDAGLLYHVVGADVVWPRCIECQIQEGDVGDCFTVRGTQVATTVEMVEIDSPKGTQKLPQYLPASEGGEHRKVGVPGIARIIKSSTHEHDGWNTVEVIVRGGEEAVHIVNGHTVFEATDLRQLGDDKKTWSPLTHGRIALQAEFAEVLYRNIEIRPLAEGPLHPMAADSGGN